jgi:hypothetical protein
VHTVSVEENMAPKAELSIRSVLTTRSEKEERRIVRQNTNKEDEPR